MKTTPPAAVSKRSAGSRVVPTRADIAALAEVLWRQAGCPEGRDEATWLEAERQLKFEATKERRSEDKAALSDPLSRLNRRSDDVMGELEELFPEGGGKETTSL